MEEKRSCIYVLSMFQFTLVTLAHNMRNVMLHGHWMLLGSKRHTSIHPSGLKFCKCYNQYCTRN